MYACKYECSVGFATCTRAQITNKCFTTVRCVLKVSVPTCIMPRDLYLVLNQHELKPQVFMGLLILQSTCCQSHTSTVLS